MHGFDMRDAYGCTWYQNGRHISDVVMFRFFEGGELATTVEYVTRCNTTGTVCSLWLYSDIRTEILKLKKLVELLNENLKVYAVLSI